MVVLGGGAVSHERGTPVHDKCQPRCGRRCERRRKFRGLEQLLARTLVTCLSQCVKYTPLSVSYTSSKRVVYHPRCVVHSPKCVVPPPPCAYRGAAGVVGAEDRNFSADMLGMCLSR